MSAEDDVEVRRLSLTNRSPYLREIEVTSYVEIVLAPRPRTSRTRCSASCSSRPSAGPETASLLCARRPRSADDARAWAIARAQHGSAHAERGRVGDRSRPVPRPRARDPSDPAAMDGRPLSGTVGAVLDPILSLAAAVRSAPGDSRASRSPPGWPPTGTRPSRSAEVRGPDVGLAHAGARGPSSRSRCGTSASRRTRPSSTSGASRVFYADRSLGAGSEILCSGNGLGQPALWGHGISGDCRSCSSASLESTTSPSCARSCAPRTTGGSRA